MKYRGREKVGRGAKGGLVEGREPRKEEVQSGGGG